ncbi:MAG TPA: hypothetical protein VGL89_18530 [Candidatus Koribacter sp.]
MRKTLWYAMAIAMIVLATSWISRRVLAASTPSVQVQLSTENVQPREVEDATETAVLRDYKLAWANLASAMEQNRADLLDQSFVGFAKERFGQAIAEQKKDGLRRRYVDHGHKVEAVFYSYDGSALQLKDVAKVEVELLDGSKVVATQPVTISYMVLMTPAENSWKVRDLEAVPGF